MQRKNAPMKLNCLMRGMWVLAFIFTAFAGSAKVLLMAAQETFTLPAGSRILVRTAEAIDSNKQTAGQRFTGTLETALEAGDQVVAPRGATVHGRLVSAQAAGRVSGGANLTLELTDIIIGGQPFPIVTSSYEMRSQGKGEQTASRIGIGAGLGALVGGIAGGGKGAGIGMAAGAGAATAVSASGEGRQVSIPAESLVEFRLEKAVTLPAR